MDPTSQRYLRGAYEGEDKDGPWKARYMCKVICEIADKQTIKRYADIGCWHGGVLGNLVDLLNKSGFTLQKVDGYDISPFPEDIQEVYPEIEFIQEDFLRSDECYDLITLNDVLEHLSAPQQFLTEIAHRTRYVAVHIPIDDRLSVVLANQYNYRIKDIGHVNFWNPSSALNLISAAGLQPLHCSFTPGFLAPSGRERIIQIIAIPVRFIVGAISPGLAAVTVGGFSLAVLCRGRLV